jgi:citrate synthase
MAKDTLTVIDNRTNKNYEIPITYGLYPTESSAIRATDLRQIKISEDDFGIMTYDPAFMNTASCRSKITFIDGEKGILRYRGYPIEELAEKSSYLETAYLVLYGELPTKAELKNWTHEITFHTFIHENIKKFIDGFHYDAHLNRQASLCDSNRLDFFGDLCRGIGVEPKDFIHVRLLQIGGIPFGE